MSPITCPSSSREPVSMEPASLSRSCTFASRVCRLSRSDEGWLMGKSRRGGCSLDSKRERLLQDLRMPRPLSQSQQVHEGRQLAAEVRGVPGERGHEAEVLELEPGADRAADERIF